MIHVVKTSFGPMAVRGSLTEIHMRGVRSIRTGGRIRALVFKYRSGNWGCDAWVENGYGCIKSLRKPSRMALRVVALRWSKENTRAILEGELAAVERQLRSAPPGRSRGALRAMRATLRGRLRAR